MLAWTFPNVTFPGTNTAFTHSHTYTHADSHSPYPCHTHTLTAARVPVYRFGDDHFDMKKFFDANIDRFDIFVFEHLNEQDSTWKAESVPHVP